MGLNKNNALKHFKDEQVFEYQIMRLGGKTLVYEHSLDSFNFRVNETSRFFMTVGSHSITSLVSLRINELTDFGNSFIGT